jgi:hypothetical protein
MVAGSIAAGHKRPIGSYANSTKTVLPPVVTLYCNLTRQAKILFSFCHSISGRRTL